MPERWIASASTSDHQPMPMQATRHFATAAIDRFLRDALVELPVAAGNADAADAFAARHDRAAAFHRGPALGVRGEREAERVQHVERLADRAGGAGRTLVRSRAHRLGRRRVHRVELAPVHALEQHQVAARVDHCDRDGDVLASFAFAIAVSTILRAPAAVRRFSVGNVHGTVYITRMPLSHIEHFLVAADDIDATRDWYARVLGMTSGPHPDFGFPVHWMYLNGVDVVHIGPSAKMAGAIQKQYLGRTRRTRGRAPARSTTSPSALPGCAR